MKTRSTSAVVLAAAGLALSVGGASACDWGATAYKSSDTTVASAPATTIDPQVLAQLEAAALTTPKAKTGAN